MKTLYLLLISFVLFFSANIYAQVPNKISYQGLLTRPSGAPAPDGSYTLIFELFSDSMGGAALWTETQSRSTQRGVYSVILGSVTALPGIFHQPLYLQVTVTSGPPIGGMTYPMTFTPRSELTSAPYALSLKLPFIGMTSSDSSSFSIINRGAREAGKFITENVTNNFPALYAQTNGNKEAVLGITSGPYCAGQFIINNPSSNNAALVGYTNGNAPGVYGWTTGAGSAGSFRIDNPSSNSPVLYAQTNGDKEAVYGITTGPYCAGQFVIDNPASNNAALVGYTNGNASGVYGWTTGLGEAGTFRIANSTNTVAALHAMTNGMGPVAVFEGGYVGIGTTNPQAKLHINGDVQISDGTQGAGKVLTSDVNGKASWQNTSPVSLKVYDSGWFAVSADASYPLTHNLGTVKIQIMLYGAIDASGTYMSTLGTPEGLDGQNKHSTVGQISPTQFTLRTGIHQLGHIWNGSSWVTATHARVIALALE